MKKILIADDDPDIQMLYSLELTEEGYEVLTWDGSSDVTALIERERPDLMVMDIGLRRYSGTNLFREIKERYEGLPVILCTFDPLSKKERKSIPADHVVIKSSNLLPLKSKVREALGIGRKQASKVEQEIMHPPKPLSMIQSTLPWHE